MFSAVILPPESLPARLTAKGLLALVDNDNVLLEMALPPETRVAVLAAVRPLRQMHKPDMIRKRRLPQKSLH